MVVSILQPLTIWNLPIGRSHSTDMCRFYVCVGWLDIFVEV